jgi:hypothetical protein
MYKDILSMTPPTALKNKIWEKVARVVLADEEPEEVKEIIDEMEKELDPEVPASDSIDMGMTGMSGPMIEE